MSDTYLSYIHLRQHEREGRDYRIEHRRQNHPCAAIAIHGGLIEPGTTEIAREIAGMDWSFYSFMGTKPKDNSSLHIASNRFDERMCLEIVGQSDVVVSVHGESTSTEQFTMIGGRDVVVGYVIREALGSLGFWVRKPPDRLAGMGVKNPCNRSRRNVGVQLEISRGLRERCLKDHEIRKLYAGCIREAIKYRLAFQAEYMG